MWPNVVWAPALKTGRLKYVRVRLPLLPPIKESIMTDQKECNKECCAECSICGPLNLDTKHVESGCHYNSTYDVHRLSPGRDGGKYEVGNMFAICPNHHAEYHRGVIRLEKVNNYTLHAVANR